MEEETKKNGRKLLVVILAVVAVAIVAVVAVVFRHMHKRATLFDATDEPIYRFFANLYPPGECEIHSLDAYYFEDSEDPEEYFYNIKYTQYIPEFDEWSDINQVFYGTHGSFDGFYCLNWDDLDGFEDANERFERAKKEGVHKTYTLEEIEKGIAAMREQIAKEDAEFEARKSGDE